jgi:RsiW-degrading membrane proteinase PrsW (M82 family)
MSSRARLFHACLRGLLVVLLAWTALGCAPHVVGATDVELTYETDADEPSATFGQDVRALVLRRLMAAGPIGADVSQEGRRVAIVVDEGLAPTVDELVTWSGTVLILEPDPTTVGAPRDDHGLVAMTETLPDGTVSHYWEGARADIARAIDQWVGDKEHRTVAEAVWSTARGAGEPRYRTRSVWARTLGELSDGILVGWGDRGTLRLRAEKGTPAEGALAAAYVRSIAARGTGASEVLVRGRTSLGHAVFEESAAHLSFGSGIEAYARAQDEKQLLTTPRLPPLKRLGAIGLPPNTALATACFVVPVLLSIAWLVFIRRFDRAHPEPVWLIAVTFVLGGLSTFPAGLAELLLVRLSPWLDPHVVSFGGQLFALPLAFVVFTVVVGVCEEGAKMLGASFAVRRPEFDEPVDGIVYGIVSSLGFAAAENVRYFALTRLSAPIVVARCFMSVPAHMFFGAIWGYALGARLVERKPRVLVFLGLAAAAHGLFDALLSTDGGAMLAVLLNVVLASVFVAVVRRSLRHGVVEEAVRAILPEHRRLFRVGRPRLFALSSLALHLLAFGVVMLGGWYQMARHRPGAVFVIGSSIMLALLAVAAFGVSATLPLDVAVDDYGVTFAGAARAWSKIRRFAVKGDRIELECEAGPIVLGPGTPAVMTELEGAIREHLGATEAERLVTLDSAR